MDNSVSRRNFLKTFVIGGVSVYVAAPFSPAFATLFEDNILTPPIWNPTTDRIKYRTDALAKVTGEKVFSFDVRAKDMPHWPQQQAHAMLLRVTKADKIYQGFDLKRLENGLMPDRIVTAEDLERDNITFPAFFGDDMLLPVGKTPQYLGQAVALFIFNDFAKFRFAKNALKFQKDIIQWGEKTGPIERNPWGTYRSVRVGNKDPYAPDIYSSMKDADISPIAFKQHMPIWPTGQEGGNLDQEGIYYANQMAKEMDSPPKDWLVLNRIFYSQSIDTCAMEPNNSNGWYDKEQQTLHLVFAAQSPIEVMGSVIEMIKRSNIKMERLILHPCSTVGYGSKDHAPEPIYGAMASLYGNGLPVRLANDRFEQFQSALKRHAFDMHFQIAINKKSHKIESLIAKYIGNGGGRSNFTGAVMAVGTEGTQGVYYIPKSDLSAVGIASRAVDAGSARGFGTVQTMPALDTLMDEAAQILQVDPIEFRLNNMMHSGMKNTQGAIPAGMLRGKSVLKKCSEHPLWYHRVDRKQEYEKLNPGKKLGIGISCVQKKFGGGVEASFAKIELSPEGEITLWHTGPEIGTGMSTSQTVICQKWLGEPAHHSHYAVSNWPELPLVTTEGSLTQAKQDEFEKNPLWTPVYCTSSSSSNSAYFFSHVTTETARLIFDYGLWPAALSIWSEGIGGGQSAPLTIRKEDARWTAEGLSADGLEPLSLARLAKRTYELGGLIGAVTHGFNRWQWANANYTIQGITSNRALDAIALKFANDKTYRISEREAIFYPKIDRSNAGATNYSAFATVVELSIDTASGKIELLDHHSVLECGNMIVPQLVSGQIEGGLAMGIGHALHEYLPLYEDGPGNGTWNFNRYRLPLASDIAVWKQSSDILPPITETDPAKGMAEVTMIPVISAITNAIANATGHYFNKHPILPKDILAVLSND